MDLELTKSESLLYSNQTEIPSNKKLIPPKVCNDRKCNWREVKGAVTPIKDQGKCNSCYAFASIAITESFAFNIMGLKTILSEQNLQDCCCNKLSKCRGKGSDPKQALSDVKTMGGIHSLKDYPWKERNEQCRRISKKPVITGNEYVVGQEKGTITRIKSWIKDYGPVAASVASQKFKEAKGTEIIKQCTGYADHVINIVGWDTNEDGVQYWIVKNSWGSEVGDYGFFYVAITPGISDCGIKEQITYLKPKNFDNFY